MKSFIKNNPLLLLIIALFVTKQLLWIGLVPALQTPDADRHFSTVMWYAEPGINAFSQNSKSSKSDMFDSTTYSIPEEYKSLLETIQFEKNRFNPNQHQEFVQNSTEGFEENEFLEKNLNSHFEKLPPTIVKYPFLYYETASWFYNLFKNNSLLTRLYFIKFYNLILGIITLYVIFRTALALNFSQKNSALIAGIISFQPMLSFMNTAINVDNLLILGVSLFVFSSILILKKSWNKKNILLILLACLIATFSKPAGAITFLFLILLFLFKIFTDSRTTKKKIAWTTLSIPLTLPIIYFACKQIPSLSRLFPSTSHFDSFSKALNFYLQNHFNLFEQYKLFTSYWGWFGWFDYPMNRFIYIFIFLILAAGIISFTIFLIKKSNLNTQKEKKVYIYLTIIILLFHFAIVYSEFSYFKKSGKMYGLQGRYFLPMTLPLFLIIIKGYQFLFKKYNFQNLLTCFFILMILLNFIALFNYIIPAYYL